MRELRTADFWPILTAPPAGAFVASWSVSRQVHHWLHARISTHDLLRIGSDHGTIEYRPDRDGALLDAVQSLLYSPTGTAPLLSRRSILAGDYHPSAMSKFGLARLRDLDRIVAPRRGDPLLPLLVTCAPVHSNHQEDNAMIDPADQQAARLLACIAASSDHRRKDGKAFWSGFFRHRVERFKDLDLAQFISRMLDVLHTDEDVFRTMLRDIYQNGQVLQRKKYRFLGHAYRIFLAGLSLTLVVFLIEHGGALFAA